ncbi:MAG: glycosyltransferase [Oscillospiraceae bacterium]|nr:glycosyltransferase [Oscillospiraceae bacterium]
MKQILILSAEPSDCERMESLSSRMEGCAFSFCSLAALKGLFKKTRFKRRLKNAVSRADLILVSPAAHAAQMQTLGKPVLPLPEGVDFEAFHSVMERNLPFPSDLFTVKNPIIGQTGPIDADANLPYIETAARAHPEWAFVFVGPVRAELSSWEGLPNIHLLGEKPRNHLPAYISRFDVCVNTAKSEDSSPVRLYEYLAAGKPIVSTPHPAQVLDYTEAVYLAGTPEEFIACCKKAIGERDAWKARRRVEYGRAASWDARAAELERVLKEME